MLEREMIELSQEISPSHNKRSYSQEDREKIYTKVTEAKVQKLDLGVVWSHLADEFGVSAGAIKQRYYNIRLEKLKEGTEPVTASTKQKQKQEQKQLVITEIEQSTAIQTQEESATAENQQTSLVDLVTDLEERLAFHLSEAQRLTEVKAQICKLLGK